MDCWVRRFTPTNSTHHQHFLVKGCASANKPCMAGGRACFIVEPCASAREAWITVGRYVRRGGSNNFNIYYTYPLLTLNGVNCKQQVVQKIITKKMRTTTPPTTNIFFNFHYKDMHALGAQGGGVIKYVN